MDKELSNGADAVSGQSGSSKPEPSESEVVMHCDKLSRHYRQGNERVDVLDSLNYKLSLGERCAIVGASGSGKSTLLALLGGLDKPSSGKVELLGQSLHELDDVSLSALRNQHMGFVYQFHHLLPEFTAVENIALPAILAGKSKDEAHEAAMSWLAKVGLDHRADHLPSELSGGERQRAAIARALVNEPKCVLMDEPTGNLDGDSSSVILQTIDELSQQSDTAFVIVTHDGNVASVMDSVYRLENGTLNRA